MAESDVIIETENEDGSVTVDRVDVRKTSFIDPKEKDDMSIEDYEQAFRALNPENNVSMHFIPQGFSSLMDRPKESFSFFIEEDENNYYFNSWNCKVIPKRITTKTAADLAVKQLAYLTSDYFVDRSKLFEEFGDTDYIQDQNIFDKEGNMITKLTPDFYRHETKTSVDFSMALGEVTALKVAREKYKKYKKYRQLGKLELYFFTINDDFFEYLNIAEKDQEIIWKTLASIYHNLGWSSKKLNKDTELPPFNEVLTKIKWENFVPKDYIDLLKENAPESELKQYKSLNVVSQEVLDNMSLFEEFVNHNMLDQAQFMNRITELYMSEDKYRPNIYWEHLYDRDKNRVKSRLRFGHRAVYLLDFPIFDTTEGDLSDKEMLEVLKRCKLKSNNPVLDFFTYYLENSEIIDKIAEDSKQIAFLHSEFRGAIEDNETDTVILGKQRELLQAKITSRVERVKTFNKEHIKDGFILTDKGFVAPIEVNYEYLKSEVKLKFNKREIKDNLRQREKDNNKRLFGNKENEDCINWQDDPNIFNETLDELFSRAPKYSLPVPDGKSFYLGNKTLNESTKSFFNTAKANTKEILTSPTCRTLFHQMRAYTSLILNDKRTGQNTGDTDNFKINRIPQHNAWVLSGVSPNNITTGYCYVASIHPFKDTVPSYVHKTEVIPTAAGNVWITGPFRCNREIVNRVEQQFGGFVSTCMMYQDFNINIWENNFYCSLYLKYSRELAAMADLVYLAYKNSFSFFTIGKYEFLDKFPNLYFKDPRVAYIFNKLHNNYPSMVKYMRKHSLKENLPFEFLDPIFGFQHEGPQSFLSVTYLKHIFAKNDGFDNAHKSFEYFKKETKQQADYEKSPFHHDKWDCRSKSFTDFVKFIFPEGPKTHKWNSFSFYPDAEDAVLAELYKRSLQKKPSLMSKNNTTNIKAMESGTNKRVIVPGNQTAMSYAVKDKVESKALSPGLPTANLSQSLTVAEIKAREFILNDAEKSEDDETKVFTGDLYKNLKNESLRLQDLVAYEILHYPQKSIVILVVKEQTGYDKRIFFVQTINKRNLHVLLESAFFKLLKTIDEDMISIPGDTKLEIIETAIHKMSASSNSYVVFTIDQTKFGDEFNLNALVMNYVTGYRMGYFTREHSLLGIFSLVSRRGRLEVMPPQTMKLINNKGKWNKFVKDHGENHNLIKFLMDNPILIDDPRIREIFSDPTNKSFTDFDELKKLRGLIKDVGFVLGVENAGASMLSASYVYMMKHMLQSKGLIDKMTGHSHSDDAYLVLALRLNKYYDFSLVNITDELPGQRMSFIEAWNWCDKVELSASSFTVKLMKDGCEPIVCGNEYLAKFVSILTIILPRLFGQRTSLAKFMFSPQGEVLQAYLINRRVITPMMRYTSSMFAELPGKSPDTDLAGLAGRLHGIQNHGGTLNLCSSLMYFMNVFTMYRYGIHMMEEATDPRSKVPDSSTSPIPTLDRWLYPTEITGFWFSHPALIYEMGFKANEIRLQDNAKYNKRIRLAVEMMSNTDDVWAQQTSIEQNQSHMKEVMAESDSIIESSTMDDEGMLGAVESRRSFLIHQSRSYKTQRAFYFMYSMILPHVDIRQAIDRLPANQQNKPGAIVKELCKEWKIDELLRTQDSRHKFMFFLKKYLTATFQESYLRIHPAVKLISKFGWLNRTLAWAFSAKFTEYLKTQKVEERAMISVRDIIKIVTQNVNKVSSINNGNTEDSAFDEDTDIYRSLRGLQVRKLFEAIYSKDFQLLDGYNRKYSTARKKVINLDYFLRWIPTKVDPERNLFNYDFRDLVARMLEKYTKRFEKYKEVFNSRVYEQNQYYYGDDLFELNVDSLADKLTGVGFDLNNVIDHITLLERMMAGVKIYRIGRFPRPDNVTDHIEEYMRDRNYDYGLSSGSISQLEISSDIRPKVNKQDIFDVLQILKWHFRSDSRIMFDPSSNIVYKNKNFKYAGIMNDIKIHTDNLYNVFDKLAIEIMLSKILIDLRLGIRPSDELKFYRIRQRNKNFINLGFRETSQALILKCNLAKDSFSIVTSETDPTWIVKVSRMLSYLFLKEKNRFEISKLEIADGDYNVWHTDRGPILTIHNPGNRDVKFEKIDNMGEDLRSMNSSFYDYENDKLIIKLNEVTLNRNFIEDTRQWVAGRIDEFLIDNWFNTRSVDKLYLNDVVINKFDLSNNLTITSPYMSSTLLGICAGLTEIKSKRVPVAEEYFKDVDKIACLSRASMLTGWNYKEMKLFADKLELLLDNRDFLLKYEKLINSRQIKKIELDITSKKDFPSLNSKKTISLRDRFSLKNAQNITSSYSSTGHSSMPSKFNLAKWIILDEFNINLPIILQIPIDLLTSILEDSRHLVTNNIDFVCICKNINNDDKAFVFEMVDIFLHSETIEDRLESISNIVQVLEESKDPNFLYPFGKEKYDNKMKIDNIVVLGSVFGVDLRNLIDVCKINLAVFNTSFTRIIYDAITNNVIHRDWIRNYFNIIG